MMFDTADLVGVLVDIHESSLLDLLKLRSVNTTFRNCVDKKFPIHDLKNEKTMMIHWIVVKGDYQLLRRETMRICATTTNKKEKQNELYMLHSLVYYGILDELQNTTLDDSQEIQMLEKLLYPRDELWSMNLWKLIIDGDPGRLYNAYIRLREFFVERFDILSKHLSAELMCDFFFLKLNRKPTDEYIFGVPMLCHIPDQHFDKILHFFETNIQLSDDKKNLLLLSLYSAQSNLEKYIDGYNLLKKSGAWNKLKKNFFVVLAIPSRSDEILKYLNDAKPPDIPIANERSYNWFIGHHILSIKEKETRKLFVKLLRSSLILHHSILIDMEIFEETFDWEVLQSVDTMIYPNEYIMGTHHTFSIQLRNHDILYRSILKKTMPIKLSDMIHPKVDITILFSLLHDDRTSSQEKTCIGSFIDSLIDCEKPTFVFLIDVQLLCWIITRRIFFQKLNPRIGPQYVETTKYIKDKFFQILKLEHTTNNIKFYDSSYSHSILSFSNCTLQLEKYISSQELDTLCSYYVGFQYNPLPAHSEYDVWKFYGKSFSCLPNFMRWKGFEHWYMKKTHTLDDLSDEQVAVIEKEFPHVVETVRKKESFLTSFKNLGLNFDASKKLCLQQFEQEKVSFSDLKKSTYLYIFNNTLDI